MNLYSNKVAAYLVAIVMLSLSACRTVPDSDHPQWVQSEPEQYPNSQYLSATGSASKLEQARSRALGNLAKVFEVQISEVSVTVDDVRTSKVQGEESVEKRQSIASTVNLETDKMVKGARIAEQWQNSADLTYHALAVLDRSQAANNIRGEMRRLDEETQYALDLHSQRRDAIRRISDLKQAGSLQSDRQVLQEALKIIDISGTGSPAKWNMAQLAEDLDRELRELPLMTRVEQDDVGGLRQILQGAATKAGLEPDNTAAGETYMLSAGLDSQQPFRKDDWHWMRSSLKLELYSLDGQTVLGYKTWMLKVSAGDRSQLAARMKKAVEDKLNEELLASVLEFSG